MNKKKDLERLSLGLATMFGLFWLYSILIAHKLPISTGLKTGLGQGVLYGLGLVLFTYISKAEPSFRHNKKKPSKKLLLLSLGLQFTAFMVMLFLTNIGSALGIAKDRVPIPMTPYMVFMLLIFNPIIEEFVFRHLFASKLLVHGERFYILASAFCFGLVHIVSLGPSQAIYTFILGLIWGYLYVKTGNLALVIIFHSLSNLFAGVITQGLMGVSMEMLGLYIVSIIALAIVALIVLIKNREKIILDESLGLMKKETIRDIATNKGILAYLGLTLLTLAIRVK